MNRYAAAFYLAAGPFAAMLLGVALVPLRGLTPASNLSFAFMVLTIVVAEFGGHWAAVATALTSALSLDFFLTRPYMTLAMEDKHDVIAFVGLCVCGLIAAGLASGRRWRLATQKAALAHRELLRSVLREWDATAPVEPQLARVMRSCTHTFPLAAAVVRDDRGRVLASTGPADSARQVPGTLLEPDLLLAEESSLGETRAWNLELPPEGGRIALSPPGGRPAWLDVWGSGAPVILESRRALSDLARLLGVLLAGAAAAGPPRSPVPDSNPRHEVG